MKPTFTVKSKLWKYSGKSASWYFLNIDKKTADNIKDVTEPGFGWGQIKINTKIGKTEWSTCLFPVKGGTFCVPIKASVRKDEKLEEGKMVKMSFSTK